MQVGNKINKFECKVLLLGEENCGKNEIAGAFLKGRIIKENEKFIFNRKSKTLENNIHLSLSNVETTRNIPFFLPFLLKDANAAVYTFDMSNRESFLNLKKIAKRVNFREKLLVILGIKPKLKSVLIPTQEALDFASKLSATFTEISISEEQQIKNFFSNLSERIKEIQLAKRFEDGIDCKRDLFQAYCLYEKAISNGTTSMKKNLAQLESKILQDAKSNLENEQLQLAKEKYEFLARKGNSSAINNLACFYKRGLLAFDLKKAYQLYKESANKGNLIAKQNLLELEPIVCVEERNGEKFWVTKIKGDIEVEYEKAWQVLRLMVVGNEKVGKSTFAKRLANIKPSQKMEVTHGVEIYDWMEETSKVKFVIFDFSGNEEYYFSHQFFFHRKCTYLLLVNLAKKDIVQDNNILYWMHFLQSRTGGDMRLILIGTHADLLTNYDRVIEDLKFNLKNLIIENQFNFDFNVDSDVWAVGSNAVFKTRQLDAFRHYATTKLGSSALEKLKLNSTHKILYENLQQLSRSLLSYDGKCLLKTPLIRRATLEQKMMEFKISKSEVSILLSDLCALGYLVFFDDNDGPLSAFIVYDLQWLNKILKGIHSINLHRNFDETEFVEEENNFVFSWKDLWEPIRDETFERFELMTGGNEMMEYVKLILIHFQILLPFHFAENSKMRMERMEQRFIVPTLLKKEKPKIENTPLSLPSYRDFSFQNSPSKRNTNFSLILDPKENSTTSFIKRIYEMKFKPPGLFQRIFLRIRNMLNTVENQHYQLLIKKLGKMLQEKIWTDSYEIEFAEWKIEIYIRQKETFVTLSNSWGTAEDTDEFQSFYFVKESDKSVSVKSHQIIIKIETKSSKKNGEMFKATKQDRSVAKLILGVIDVEIENFKKEWFPSLSLKHEDRKKGWDAKCEKNEIIIDEKLDFSEHISLASEIVMCKWCSGKCKLQFKNQECKNCFENLLILDRFAVLKKVDVASSQGVLYHCYDILEKQECALKEILEPDDKIKSAKFAREISLLQQINDAVKRQESMINPNAILKFHFTDSVKYVAIEWIADSVSLNEIDFSVNDRFVSMLVSILQCLTLLHDNLLVHQDVDDLNILFSPNQERFILIDFGAVIPQPKANDPLSEPLISLGKGMERKYLVAPEQLQMRPTTKSDLYSLGKLCENIIKSQITRNKPLLLPDYLVCIVHNMCRNEEIPEKEQFCTAREVLQFLSQQDIVKSFSFVIPAEFSLTKSDSISDDKGKEDI